jgi:hypothetical protein
VLNVVCSRHCHLSFPNALLDEELEAARLAGDLQRMRGLLAEKTILLRRMYGWRSP